MEGKGLNIPSYIEDPNYRYKMPKLILKIEGKGNGIKTNIVNLNDAAKALGVPAEYPLKYMGHELGAHTECKEKGYEAYIINGEKTSDVLKNLMDKFIEKYILCPRCKYPEMYMVVKKKISGICKSCGWNGELDNKHKLATFIMKNPPPSNGLKTDIDEEKTKEKLHQTTNKKKKKGESENKEKETIKKTESKEKSEIKEILPTDIKNKLYEEYIKQIGEVYQKLDKKGKETFAENNQAVDQMFLSLNSLKLPKENKNSLLIYILFSSIFDINIAKQVEKNSYLIKELIEKLNMEDAQIHCLLTLQDFLLTKNNAINYEKYIPTIMKLFFDEDIFEEEFLNHWYDKKSIEQLKKVSPLYNEKINSDFLNFSKDFLEWLKSESAQ